MPFEPLTTERLVLGPLGPSDAPIVHNYWSDSTVGLYQSWEPTGVEEVSDFIERMFGVEPNTPGTWLQLAIRERRGGALIGDCGLHFPGDREHEAEFGITLMPAHQGKGYAGEALRAILGYLFFTLDKHRVYGSTDPRNTACRRMMERVGMRQEAHFRESLWFKGGWVDDVVYAMLRREWLDRPDVEHD
jgi:RimJ/RimL family protein N-acetyltransferase